MREGKAFFTKSSIHGILIYSIMNVSDSPAWPAPKIPHSAMERYITQGVLVKVKPRTEMLTMTNPPPPACAGPSSPLMPPPKGGKAPPTETSFRIEEVEMLADGGQKGGEYPEEAVIYRVGHHEYHQNNPAVSIFGHCNYSGSKLMKR
ncbi:MAG: hypothetical protein U1C55_07280 [Smithellaceae bacterium]|nr:hypothetical protein [Smithellaceae bacterium]